MVFGWWRQRRRQRLLATPFPHDWLPYLEVLFFYHTLTDKEQAKLRDDVQVFCAEKTWEGCDLNVTDEMKVTIAGQACLLTLNLASDSYRRMQTILVSPTEYQSEVREQLGNVVIEGEATMLGQAHYRGPVKLAWDEVRESSRDPSSGTNLVFHEFAHQLDMLDGEANGAPPLPRHLGQRWQQIMAVEFEYLIEAAEMHRPTLLDPYGVQDEAEFFAVVTECFFTRPQAMRDEHQELYELLRDYYQQDPARRVE